MNANPYRVYDRGEEIKISRSSSNPGELRFDIPDMAALRRAAAVFADLTEQNVTRILRSGGLDDTDAWPVIDSLRYKQFKGGEQGGDPDRWDAWTWWENEDSGVNMELQSDWDHVVVRVEPRGFQGKWEDRGNLVWEHRFSRVKKSRFRRLDAKSYFIRALQLYLNSLVKC
jgi:hypothetical protein